MLLLQPLLFPVLMINVLSQQFDIIPDMLSSTSIKSSKESDIILPQEFNETLDFENNTNNDDSFYININDMTGIETEYGTLVKNVNSLDETVNQGSTTEQPVVITSTDNFIKSTVATRVKMSKTIKTYKSSVDQVLRQFVENGYLRQPIACIVDTAERNLKKSQILWNATLRSNMPLDILLSGYNSTGIGGIYSFKNTRTLLTGLSSMRESSQTAGGGKAFAALMKTYELIPYDSAIFISTDEDPMDVELFDRVAILLIKKRIRLYLIWFGDVVMEDNETFEKQGKSVGKLGELSLITGGEILHITNDALDKNGLITLFAKTGVHETLDFEIPIQALPTMQPPYIKTLLNQTISVSETKYNNGDLN